MLAAVLRNRGAKISARTDVGQLVDFEGERGVLEGLLHLIPTKDTCKYVRMCESGGQIREGGTEGVPRSPPSRADEQSLSVEASLAKVSRRSTASLRSFWCCLRISIASCLERVISFSRHELGLRLPLCLMSKWDARILLLLFEELAASDSAVPPLLLL